MRRAEDQEQSHEEKRPLCNVNFITIKLWEGIATDLNGNPENEVSRGKEGENFIKIVRMMSMATEKSCQETKWVC